MLGGFILGSLFLWFFFCGRWEKEKELREEIYRCSVDDLLRKSNNQDHRDAAVYEMVKRFNSLK